MFSQSRVAAVRAGLVLALLAGAGCQQKPSAETQGKLNELTKVSNERDRLLAEMAENARMMSQISADLAKVRIPARQLRVSKRVAAWRSAGQHGSEDPLRHGAREGDRAEAG